MKRIKQLINEYGGTVEFARRIGVAPQTVSGWISRKRIPYTNWQAIEQLGVPFDRLREIDYLNRRNEKKMAKASD